MEAEKIEAIKLEYASGALQRELAEKYGCTQTNISFIVSGQNRARESRSLTTTTGKQYRAVGVVRHGQIDKTLDDLARICVRIVAGVMPGMGGMELELIDAIGRRAGRHDAAERICELRNGAVVVAALGHQAQSGMES